jgi:hypothetical protein
VAGPRLHQPAASLEPQLVRELRQHREHDRKRSRRRALALAAMMVASFVLALTASDIAHRERAPSPLVATGTIIWGGRIFSTAPQLRAWLHSRGAEYAEWAVRHRAAARAQRNPAVFGAAPDTTPDNAMWPYLGLFGALALMLIVFMRLTPSDVSARGGLARSASVVWYVLAIATSCAAGLIVADLLR